MQHATMSTEARRWLGEPFPFSVEIAVRGGWKIDGDTATSPRGVTYSLDAAKTHARRVAS